MVEQIWELMCHMISYTCDPEALSQNFQYFLTVFVTEKLYRSTDLEVSVFQEYVWISLNLSPTYYKLQRQKDCVQTVCSTMIWTGPQKLETLMKWPGGNPWLSVSVPLVRLQNCSPEQQLKQEVVCLCWLKHDAEQRVGLWIYIYIYLFFLFC